MDTQILNQFDCNNVQIFILENVDNNNIIDLKTNLKVLNKIRNKYNFKKNKFVSYYNNDLQYQYDKSNDNQIVTNKNTHHINSQKYRNFDTYSVYSSISKLPTYLFPCTESIDNKNEYDIEEYKVNNRISLIIKTNEYSSHLYIEYNHSPQVEIEKIESCIKNILSYITSDQ